MKPFILMIFAISAMPVAAQTQSALDAALTRLPPHLNLSEPKPQKYEVTTDYFNGDIFGSFINKTRVSGTYTRGYTDGTVKWNNVTTANADTRNGAFPRGDIQPYMENFTYSSRSNLLDASAFPAFPPSSFYEKNLVWDVLTIEIVAWSYFDSLELNKPYRPKTINGAVPLAGDGTFENKDFQLTWSGISRMNGEVCALIDFHAFDNPLTVDTEQLKIHGRSHYWGQVWVSLTDKQIEHAILLEDVVMKMRFGGNENEQLLDTRREIVMEKLN